LASSKEPRKLDQKKLFLSTSLKNKKPSGRREGGGKGFGGSFAGFDEEKLDMAFIDMQSSLHKEKTIGHVPMAQKFVKRLHSRCKLVRPAKRRTASWSRSDGVRKPACHRSIIDFFQFLEQRAHMLGPCAQRPNVTPVLGR
jgi:hypothetical protein